MLVTGFEHLILRFRSFRSTYGVALLTFLDTAFLSDHLILGFLNHRAHSSSRASRGFVFRVVFSHRDRFRAITWRARPDGTGIQTAPGAARCCAALVLGEPVDERIDLDGLTVDRLRSGSD